MKIRKLGTLGLAAMGSAMLLQAAPALADPPWHAPAWGRGHDCDHHAHYHPHLRPGYVVTRLPPWYRVARFGGQRYYYDLDDTWYRPYGPRFIVVAPPVSLVADRYGLRGYVVAEAPRARW
jgi:hypothetical protein